MGGVELLRQAQKAGLTVCAEGDRLKIKGPKKLSGLVQQLIDHKSEILAALTPSGPTCDLAESTTDAGAGAKTAETPRMNGVSAPAPPKKRRFPRRVPDPGDAANWQDEPCMRESLHIKAERWEHRDGKAYCPGCQRFMGYVRATHDGGASLP